MNKITPIANWKAQRKKVNKKEEIKEQYIMPGMISGGSIDNFSTRWLTNRLSTTGISVNTDPLINHHRYTNPFDMWTLRQPDLTITPGNAPLVAALSSDPQSNDRDDITDEELDKALECLEELDRDRSSTIISKEYDTEELDTVSEDTYDSHSVPEKSEDQLAYENALNQISMKIKERSGLTPSSRPEKSLPNRSYSTRVTPDEENKELPVSFIQMDKESIQKKPKPMPKYKELKKEYLPEGYRIYGHTFSRKLTSGEQEHARIYGFDDLLVRVPDLKYKDIPETINDQEECIILLSELADNLATQECEDTISGFNIKLHTREYQFAYKKYVTTINTYKRNKNG